MDIYELQKEVSERLYSRKVRDNYRHAMRTRSMFAKELVQHISRTLNYDVMSWLMLNGYKPDDDDSFLEVMTVDFDFGNEVGIAVSVQAVMEDDTKPANLRMILCLLRETKRLGAEIAHRDGVILSLREQLQPSIFTRAVRYLRSKLVNNKTIDEE